MGSSILNYLNRLAEVALVRHNREEFYGEDMLQGFNCEESKLPSIFKREMSKLSSIFYCLVIFWLCFWCIFYVSPSPSLHQCFISIHRFLLLCTSVFHLCSSCFSFSAQGFHLRSSCFSQFLSLIPSPLLLSQCRLLCFFLNPSSPLFSQHLIPMYLFP